MAYFSTQYGPFRMPKWCFLQCGEILLKCNYLIFNTLTKPLITRIFAPDEEPARKYSLIFWGRTGNWGRETEIRLQSESAPYRHHLSWM